MRLVTFTAKMKITEEEFRRWLLYSHLDLDNHTPDLRMYHKDADGNCVLTNNTRLFKVESIDVRKCRA